ncbi:hypothetical protein BRADI_4g04244v3, partial [Brachypodium distachyon]
RYFLSSSGAHFSEPSDASRDQSTARYRSASFRTTIRRSIFNIFPHPLFPFFLPPHSGSSSGDFVRRPRAAPLRWTRSYTREARVAGSPERRRGCRRFSQRRRKERTVDIMNSNEDEVPGGAPEEDKSTDLIPNTVDENHWQSKTHQLKMQEQLSERL